MPKRGHSHAAIRRVYLDVNETPLQKQTLGLQSSEFCADCGSSGIFSRCYIGIVGYRGLALILNHILGQKVAERQFPEFLFEFSSRILR